uniref:p20A n=1 Tax=Grapevine leafroll-associated virus 3 TaxID=55951 RepID=A0A3S9SDN3_9CLOS|nr:p20A [Grapevine leafroll-associated virus 3]
MKLFSLHFLILKLSKSIKTNDHFNLILIKEALINYYNASYINETAVLADAKEGIASFLTERCKTSRSCAIMKALINHTLLTTTVESIRSYVGDLIIVADSSISALEEAKSIRDTRRVNRRKGRYYYCGVSGSDVAKVRYILKGEGRSKGGVDSLLLNCEGKTSDGSVLQYILVSSVA